MYERAALSEERLADRDPRSKTLLWRLLLLDRSKKEDFEGEGLENIQESHRRIDSLRER